MEWFWIGMAVFLVAPIALVSLLKLSIRRGERFIRQNAARAEVSRRNHEERMAAIHRSVTERDEFQTACAEAFAKIDDLKGRARSTYDARRVSEATARLSKILREGKKDSLKELTDEISEFTRRADWLLPR
jgi:hypothetical protein